MKTYDPKCHALAVSFLSDEEKPGPILDKAADDLAKQIQDLIESFIESDLIEFREGRA
jgi:hypothetical protein